MISIMEAPYLSCVGGLMTYYLPVTMAALERNEGGGGGGGEMDISLVARGMRFDEDD